MNNIELEAKIKEIINIENYFDMVIAMKNFEKDYKNTEFYKVTKQPLEVVIKNAKIHYTLQFTNIKKNIQDFVNNFDMSSLENLMNQISTTFGQENADILSVLKDFKDLQ